MSSSSSPSVGKGKNAFVAYNNIPPFAPTASKNAAGSSQPMGIPPASAKTPKDLIDKKAVQAFRDAQRDKNSQIPRMKSFAHRSLSVFTSSPVGGLPLDSLKGMSPPFSHSPTLHASHSENNTPKSTGTPFAHESESDGEEYFDPDLDLPGKKDIRSRRLQEAAQESAASSDRRFSPLGTLSLAASLERTASDSSNHSEEDIFAMGSNPPSNHASPKSKKEKENDPFVLSSYSRPVARKDDEDDSDAGSRASSVSSDHMVPGTNATPISALQEAFAKNLKAANGNASKFKNFDDDQRKLVASAEKRLSKLSDDIRAQRSEEFTDHLEELTKGNMVPFMAASKDFSGVVDFMKSTNEAATGQPASSYVNVDHLISQQVSVNGNVSGFHIPDSATAKKIQQFAALNPENGVYCATVGVKFSSFFPEGFFTKNPQAEEVQQILGKPYKVIATSGNAELCEAGPNLYIVRARMRKDGGHHRFAISTAYPVFMYKNYKEGSMFSYYPPKTDNKSFFNAEQVLAAALEVLKEKGEPAFEFNINKTAYVIDVASKLKLKGFDRGVLFSFTVKDLEPVLEKARDLAYSATRMDEYHCMRNLISVLKPEKEKIEKKKK